MASHQRAIRRSRGEAEARVAALLARSNRPITAYEIAHRCADEGHAVAPTQVYRALTRLLEQGKIARIESLAAYVPRQGPFDVCLICDRCHGVLLLPDPALAARLADRARRLGFEPTRLIVESRGLCADCVEIETALRERRRMWRQRSALPEAGATGTAMPYGGSNCSGL